jgi:vacuolar protein sorting-associated protein 54
VRTGLFPHTAGQPAPRAPSSKEIPPVTLTNIPHVDPKAFLPYLSQAGSLYDAFQRAKEGVDDGGAQQSRKSRYPPRRDPVSGPFSQGLQKRYAGSPTLSASPSVPGSPVEQSPQARRKSGANTRRGQLQVNPLSTVPSVYFEQDFRLENPRTFDIVSERSEIVRPQPGANGSVVTPGSSGRKALATNAILQEKLSWYMDTVELHLISSISTASTSFFAALGSLRELHLEASDSVAKIQTLRKDLARLDEDMAVGGLKVAAMRRRRENMRKLGNAIQQLSRVIEAVARCEEQIDNGEIEDALQGLTDVEILIEGHDEDCPSHEPDQMRKSPKPNLHGVKALEGIDTEMAHLKKRIGKGFEARLLEALLGDLRNHVDTTPSKTTFQRWDQATQRFRTGHSRAPVSVSYLHLEDSLRSSLKSHLTGLNQSDSVMPATVAYREAVLREIKALIRRHLPSSSDDDVESTMSASTQGGRQLTQQEKSTVLARNLRILDPEDAEELLKKIYSNVGEALRRLGTQVKVLLDVTSSFGDPPSAPGAKSPLSPPTANADSYLKSAPPRSARPHIPQEEIQQALDMSQLLGEAVDIAQTQVTKILKVRSEQSVHLPLSRFLTYFHLNRLFANECEAVSGRGGTALKTVVNTHIKDFVTQFAETERQRLIRGMDADRWDAKDFTMMNARILDRILEASTRDVEAWTKAGIICEDGLTTANGETEANGQAINGSVPVQDKIRSAVIDEQRYMLPASALIIMCGIEQFENLIAGIPSMTQEITSSLLDYLGLFNSRSQQLILGAGATKSAGLKNITTKHLALSSQALSFLIALTPHVREFVRRHSSGAGGLMTEFDRMKRGYQEHQVGLNEKLVEIMSGRATTHVNAMKKINWEAGSNSQTVNGYMETLVKETATLHKVLGKYLPEMSVRAIMEPVFRSYDEQWGRAFQEVDIKTAAAKEKCVWVLPCIPCPKRTVLNEI